MDNNYPAVLVTPSCDIENNNTNLWTFVALIPDVIAAKQMISPQSVGRDKEIKNTLRLLIRQQKQRYHWLPIKIDNTEAHVADFSCVTSINSTEIQTTATRVAALKSSWREQLTTRYAMYMGRIGVDDFIESEVNDYLERLTITVKSSSI